MDVRHAVLTFSLFGIALAPAVARADHDDGVPSLGVGVEVHMHGPNCNHGPPPAGAPTRDGRYELRTVQKWVPGHYERVWVPERCRTQHKHRGHVTRCRGGYYDQVFRPGQYVTAQEWVWVPYGRGGRGAYHYAHHAQAPAGSPVVQWRVSGRF